MALPDLHQDFSISQKLHLSVDKINAEYVKKWSTDCWGKLINVKNDWERSGSGKAMATAADGDERAKLEIEVYEFKDRDDRQCHLYTTALHILYLWELSNQVPLLNKVCQQLSGECAADKQTPRVMSGKRPSPNKTKDKEDDGSSSFNDIDSHMSNLTESIDGLVGVATSLLAQQKEVLQLGRPKDLCKRRMDTFERNGFLDDAIMELELKAVDEVTKKLSSARGMRLSI
jgi:hypothetical protein